MKNPIINENDDKFWYNEKGQYHRDDGPAIEYQNGSKEYYQNGLLHREDGPAIEYGLAAGHGKLHKQWRLHGKLHREDGPAFEGINGDKEYWINGVQYDSLDAGLMDQALS